MSPAWDQNWLHDAATQNHTNFSALSNYYDSGAQSHGIN